MAAASGGSLGCAVELLRAGATVDLVDIEGRTAGYYANEANHHEIARLLVNVKMKGLTTALKVFRLA